MGPKDAEFSDIFLFWMVRSALSVCMSFPKPGSFVIKLIKVTMKLFSGLKLRLEIYLDEMLIYRISQGDRDAKRYIGFCNTSPLG